MTELRRKTVPPCPECDHPGDVALHGDLVGGLPCGGPLWVDIHTGNFSCGKCGVSTSLERTIHNCVCGCRYTGGEAWQGMRADVARVGNQVLARKLGIQKGTLETRILQHGSTYRSVQRLSSTTEVSGQSSGCLGCSGCLEGFLRGTLGAALLSSLVGIVLLFTRG